MALQGHPKSSILVPIESEYAITNGNFGRISYRFRDIDTFSSNNYISFSPPRPCLTPSTGGTPCDINIFYTPLESTFNGL